MGALLHNNRCMDCEYYESEANDYYYEWCTHPALEENPDRYLTDEFGGDSSEWVKICPITGESPYEDDA